MPLYVLGLMGVTRRLSHFDDHSLQIWFLFAATIAGCLLAWALVAWHTKHPTRGLPKNQIVLR